MDRAFFDLSDYVTDEPVTAGEGGDAPSPVAEPMRDPRAALPAGTDWCDLPELDALVEAIAVPALVHQGSLLLAANEPMQRLLGRDRAALLGLPLPDLVGEASREALLSAARSCLERGDTPPAIEAQLLTRTGSARPVELHQRVLPRARGRVVLVTCLDQSDIQHVQQGLFMMGRMLAQIIDGAPIATLVVDASHRITHWNAAIERLTGVGRRSAVGSNEPWRAFYDAPRPMLVDLIVDAVDDAQLRQVYDGHARRSSHVDGGLEAELHFPRLGEGGAWLRLSAVPLRDGDGRITGAIETLQDVTSERRAQEELRQHHDLLEEQVQQRSAELAVTARELERFVSNAPIGVALLVEGSVRRVNRTLAQMLGYTEEQVQNQPARRYFRSEAEFKELLVLSEPVLGRGQTLHHEMWMRRADGQDAWVQIDAHLADHDNRRGGTWWMIQDRTDIRQAQQELQDRFDQLERMNRQLEEAQHQLLQQDKMASIGQLAAGVAHEINNPVAFVSSNLNTLRQYVDGLLALCDACERVIAEPGDDQALQALVRQREQSDIDYLREDLPTLLTESADGLNRVKKIVLDLKDFSRVDQSEWQEADLNAGVESTLNVVRNEVKYKAEVVRQLQPLPPVLCLAGQLNQIYLNLIINAVQAIDEHGTITLSSGVVGKWAWVQVDDTGRGMSDEVQRRIFEPFFTTKEVGKGTGLGLSLSFSIAKRHGGAIQVRSAPGQGSSFRVWVPIGGPQSLKANEQPPRG